MANQKQGNSQNITTNHNEIRQWIETRGGFPAAVKSTSSDEEPGQLSVDFPGFEGEDPLERISWEDFFQKFDEKDLAFLYQEKTKDGRDSLFSQFIRRGGSKK